MIGNFKLGEGPAPPCFTMTGGSDFLNSQWSIFNFKSFPVPVFPV
jgi:hypothetical protein